MEDVEDSIQKQGLEPSASAPALIGPTYLEGSLATVAPTIRELLQLSTMKLPNEPLANQPAGSPLKTCIMHQSS